MRFLLEGDSLSFHHSMLLSLIHWSIYGITAWVRKIQIFFIVLCWDWEWGVDQSYDRTNVAMFQIMCLKTKMKVFYNNATLSLLLSYLLLLMSYLYYWGIYRSITKWVQNILIFSLYWGCLWGVKWYHYFLLALISFRCKYHVSS